jgi:Ras-related protein Rab-5C
MSLQTTGTFYTQRVELEDDSTVKFNIWDTAGQERFRSVAPLYYRGAAAAVVVYDITSYLSFSSAKSWIEELRERGDPDVLIALVGNKIDLEPSKNTVTFEEAEAYASDQGILHLGTSAKTAKNVRALFVEIAEALPKPDPLPPDEESSDTPLLVESQTDRETTTKAQRLASTLSFWCCFKRKKRSDG